jgi:hypothetical protein
MSLPARRAKRIDANQPDIVQALRKGGAKVWVLGTPCDLLVGVRGRFRTLEVKDGTKPPSKRALTPDEQDYFDACRAHALPHHVVTSVDEAVEVVFGPSLAKPG